MRLTSGIVTSTPDLSGGTRCQDPSFSDIHPEGSFRDQPGTPAAAPDEGLVPAGAGTDPRIRRSMRPGRLSVGER